MKQTRLDIIIEKNDGLLWGRVEEKGNFTPTPYGKTTKDLVENLKELIRDYVTHEGKQDKFWSKVNPEKLELNFRYDLQAFFTEHEFLNVSAIANRAGMNPSLVRQYTTGSKYPSLDQTKKIEKAVHHIGEKLQKIKLVDKALSKE